MLKKPRTSLFRPSFPDNRLNYCNHLDIFRFTQNQNIKFTKTTLRYRITIIKDSAPYFLSRIASSVYNFCNTIIILEGFIYPGKAVVGYYTSADKFVALHNKGCSPVADSFYTYMIRTRDYKKLLRTVLILESPLLGNFGFYLLYLVLERNFA